LEILAGNSGEVRCEEYLEFAEDELVAAVKQQ
jgi:hypothetical protein